MLDLFVFVLIYLGGGCLAFTLVIKGDPEADQRALMHSGFG